MDVNVRCHSMPHLSDPYPHPMVPAARKKKYSQVLKSVHKWIRAVLRLRSNSEYSSSSNFKRNMANFEIYGGYLSCEGLTTIPEGCEKGTVEEESPEFGDAVVRKTLSERYTSSTGMLPCMSHDH